MTKYSEITYIAGPYSSKWGIIGNAINIWKARRAAQRLWREGRTVICPHLNSAFMTGLTQPQWVERDLKMLEFCSHIYMLKRWPDSPGALREWQFAKDKGLVVEYER